MFFSACSIFPQNIDLLNITHTCIQSFWELRTVHKELGLCIKFTPDPRLRRSISLSVYIFLIHSAMAIPVRVKAIENKRPASHCGITRAFIRPDVGNKGAWLCFPRWMFISHSISPFRTYSRFSKTRNHQVFTPISSDGIATTLRIQNSPLPFNAESKSALMFVSPPPSHIVCRLCCSESTLSRMKRVARNSSRCKDFFSG